jgi:TRAP-type C4-dicarboxylate transport system permease small subunit
VRAVINLVRPDWTLFRTVYGVFVHCGGLAIVYFLIRADSWVTAADSAAGGANGYAHAAQIVNQWIYYGLLVTAIFSTVMLIVRVTRIIRQPRQGGGSTRVGEPAKERD